MIIGNILYIIANTSTVIANKLTILILLQMSINIKRLIESLDTVFHRFLKIKSTF